jgi:hypothetical protein
MKDKIQSNQGAFLQEDIPEEVMAKLKAAYQLSESSLVSACPDPEMISAYAFDELSLQHKAQVHDHLSECKDCLDLVIELRSAVDQVREEKHKVNFGTPFHRIRSWLSEFVGNLMKLLSSFVVLPKLVPAAIALVVVLAISIGVYRNLTAPISIQISLIGLESNGLLTRGSSEERKIFVSKGGILHSGDKFQIGFETNKDAYVYVFFQDSAGKVTNLFSGEVPADKRQTIPGGKDWFELDENKGQEKVHIMAAKHPINNHEEMALQLEKGGIDSLKKLYPNASFQSFSFQHE